VLGAGFALEWRTVPLEPSQLLLEGRVAVVTGAAVGLGAAIAGAFARFGADLALCDQDEENLAATAESARAHGRRVHAKVLDVRDGAAAADFLAEAGRQLGAVEVLVNNAGGGFQAPFLDLGERGQDALVRENFTSVTHFVRGFVPLVPERGGSIVNITSIEAHRAAPGFAIYSAMKAALANLTRSLALELADRRIRVNCIAPDMIPTPGIGPLPEGRTPLRRAGHPDDVAGAALFLASELSGFVTGTTIHVDGGSWAAGGWRRDADGSWQV
jgi:NAD(P)-dependent dehydrogenase (short-subunit alcohol dehydrogenase family)